MHPFPPPASVTSALPDFWPAAWEYLDSPPASGVENMAVDLTLLRMATHRQVGVLRTYRWTRPTVSFGRSEVIGGLWSLDALRQDGFDIVRRPTGGRALLHEFDLTYSVAMPLGADVPWRAAYDAVNALLVAALRHAGIPVVTAPLTAPTVAGNLCFDAPSAGELLVGRDKVAGSAVWRSQGGYLQHGSILLRNVQDRLLAYRTGEAPPPEPVSSFVLEPTVPWPGCLLAVWPVEPTVFEGLDTVEFEKARAELASAEWMARR